MEGPLQWSCSDVSKWLKENGFQKYCQLLCEEHQIDGQGLLNLTESDLKQPPIGIRVIGDVKRLTCCIKNLKLNPNGRKNGTITSSANSVKVPSETFYQFVDINAHSSLNGVCDIQIESNDFPLKSQQNSRNIEPEGQKALMSLVYMLISLYCTCFSIVVVQAKAPDQQKHPPLPDLFLDHFPEVSWAYKVSDTILISLITIWSIIVILHKHRLVLMRRTCCLLGSMYLLRCVCILITQLPVPESNVRCNRKNYTDFSSKAGRALEIFIAGGMKVSGLRTCGDYMFSGHTVTMTLMNFFITEYTPKKLCCLHVFSWMANVFGMFFILAGHGHYSIDVFVAFVLTSRLFCYYHTLANNIDLICRNTNRNKIIFPIFTYFESNSTGVIPYKFDWPFPTWTQVKTYLRGYEQVFTKEKS